MKKLKVLKEKYKDMYNINVNPEYWSESKALRILNLCEKRKKEIMLNESFNSYMKNKDYIKVFLLEEMAKIILREIAPKRLSRRKRSKNV